MPRPPRGIYHDGGAIVFSGYRKPADPAGLTWETVTDPVQRNLLRSEEFVNLRWAGAVVLRDQSEIDARIRTEVIAADNAHFERDQFKAILLVLLDEINTLRAAAGLNPPRTIQQAKAAYEAKLNR